MAQARLGDADTEIKGLEQRLVLERSRVSELEGLLAGMRAREFRSGLEVDKSGGQLGLLQERNRILEDQVRMSITTTSILKTIKGKRQYFFILHI